MKRKNQVPLKRAQQVLKVVRKEALLRRDWAAVHKVKVRRGERKLDWRLL
jgi:hypothetical protein